MRGGQSCPPRKQAGVGAVGKTAHRAITQS